MYKIEHNLKDKKMALKKIVRELDKIKKQLSTSYINQGGINNG